MKQLFSLLLVTGLVISAGCQQKSSDHEQGDDHETNDGLENSPNQALYEDVMDIHDQVMPKMNDLHKAKSSLQTRLTMPGTGESEKEDIQNQIARIDSASEGMMVWMRQFNPLPDSAGEEEARAYLESELIKVKKVRQNILDALKSTPQ